MYFKIEDRAKIVKSADRFINIFEMIQGQNCLNDITGTISRNEIQNLIYLFLNRDREESDPVTRTIIRECIAAEQMSAGSSVLILSLLSYYFSKHLDKTSNKERISAEQEVRLEIIKSAIELSRHVKRANRQDIEKIIKSMSLSENLEKSLIDVVENYKIGEKLEIKKTKLGKTYIEKKKGNFLPIETPQISLGGKNLWTASSVNTILIDGVIENISQIHHLLESASDTREPYLIICRKAAKEVRETVDINFLRGTVDLILIETDFDPMYHHLFLDMSAIFKCEFVNIQMGDSLSSRIDKFTFKIDNVEINHKGINLLHDRENDKIQKYIAEIREFISKSGDLDAESISAIEKSIDFRTRFLESNTVILNIGVEDLDETNSSMSKIDTFIRTIPDISTYGVLDFVTINTGNSLIENICIRNERNFVTTQKQVFHSLLTSFNIYKTINRAEKLFTIIK